jgi:HAMP domain-containing protein
MRQRIFLGFASILVLFIGVGLYAVWLFSQISTIDQLDAQARVLSVNATQTMLLVLLVGVGIVLSVYFATRRAIFKPIQTLAAVAKELGTGNLDQVVPMQSNDEIGALAAAFNKLSSKLRAYRQITAEFYLDLPAISKGAKA